MPVLKQFRFALWGLFAIYVLWLLPACGNPGSSSCNHPNPIVTFQVPNQQGFAVTPDSIAQATSVRIEVSGHSGSPDTSFNGQPGVATLIHLDTSFHRPLQLKFIYKTASGEVLSEDQLRIDDTHTRGVILPDMDVVVGVTSFPSCPGAPNAVTVNTSNGVSTFPWSPGDGFEVRLTYNGTTSKFRLHPEDGIQGGAGKLTLYERPSQQCLSDITTQAVSSKELAITSISNTCTVRGWEDGTTRTITIQHPTNATIQVYK